MDYSNYNKELADACHLLFVYASEHKEDKELEAIANKFDKILYNRK